MVQFIRRHPFLLLGLLTLGSFFAVDTLNRTGYPEMAAAAAKPMRVLIIPMYLVWTLLTIVKVAITGPNGMSGVVGRLVSLCVLIAGFAPYILADYVLARWRRSHEQSDVAA